jgi:alkylation response protein AidB-like acyl-CoA dehydrogenase
MDFGYTSEQEALRQEVIDWIAENMTAEIFAEMKGGEGGGETRQRGRGSLVSELFKKIGAKGWLGISWPKKIRWTGW